MIDSGYSYFNISDNKITVTTTISFRGFVSDYIKCKSNTNYKVSYKTEQTGITFETNYAFYDENKIFIVRNNTGLSPANAEYIRVNPISYSSTTIDYYDIQLEESSTATSYVAHKEQTFTFPLGNEKLMLGDYLADDGIHHVRGQVVLDGTEVWLRNELTTGQRFALNVANFNFKKITSLGDDLLSNYFKGISYNAYYSTGGINGVSYNYYNNINYLQIFLKENYTLNEFKTWLSTHNITVEYELEEEVIVPYTSAQQEVYNQIKRAISYEEQTNISSNTIALFNVEAYQNTKLILQYISNAIVALGGV